MKQKKQVDQNLCHHLYKSKLKKVDLTTIVLVGLILATQGFCSVSANAPPRFILEEGDGADIVVRLREGTATPPGTVIYIARGFDPDGDQITFGLNEATLGPASSGLVTVTNSPSGNEANIVLNKYLDAEFETQHQLVLTLTDNNLGQGNFITQSLVIIVDDVNDNSPIFEPHQPSILVREHSATPLQLATIR